MILQKPNGPKTRIPKPSKASDSVQQDDIEIEIAEVLFGLKKQSQNSKGEKDVSVEKLESKDLKSMDQELEPIQKNSAVADPLPGNCVYCSVLLLFLWFLSLILYPCVCRDKEEQI